MHDEAHALEAADRVGFPVMLKATTGGGSIGMLICDDVDALHAAFSSVKKRAEVRYCQTGVLFTISTWVLSLSVQSRRRVSRALFPVREAHRNSGVWRTDLNIAR